MNPDGLTYLDMANAALVNGPGELINGLRSPAYPALLSLAIGIFRPERADLDTLVHAVNFLLFCLCLSAFAYYLKGTSALDRREGGGGRERDILVPLGFGFFMLLVLNFIGLASVVPDLMVTASVFWAAGLCVRFGTDGKDGRRALLLGVALGLGYYAK